MLARLFVEVKRQLRRADGMARAFSEEPFEEEAFQLQISRLSALEPAMEDYLQEARESLPKQILGAETDEQRDILGALNDLRIDAATTLLPLLHDPEFDHKDMATAVLRWSRHEGVGPLLRGWVQRTLPVAQRGMKRLRAWSPNRTSVPDDFPYDAIL